MVERVTLAEAESRLGRDATTIAMRHAAWRAGNLSWLLHDGKASPEKGQLAARALARSAPARVVVYDIARRWGKSFYFATEAIETCLATPGGRVPYACGTVTSLREFIVPIFAQIIATAPLDVRPEIVGDEVRFQNGARIVFAACEDRAKAERLRGPKSHKIIVDEAGFIPVLSYVVNSVLLFQLAGTGGKLLMGSSPPESPSHPFVEFYQRAEADHAAMTATIYDTPLLTTEDIGELCYACGGADSVTWRREGLAEFITDPTRAIVPEFTTLQSKLVEAYTPVTPDGYDKPSVDRYIVGDLGFVDLSAVLFAEWDFNGAMLSVIDEHFSERTTTDLLQHAVDDIAKERWGHEPVYRRHMDASARARADLQRLQDDGDPTAENAWRAANNQERDVLVNRLRLATSRLRYRIHPRCENLIRQLRHGVWNERRTDFARADGYGHFDGVAAMMYLERHVDRTHNPTPPKLWDMYSQIGPKPGDLPAGTDALRRYNLRQAFNRPRKT